MQKTPVVCIAAMLCCLLWGSAFPVIKIGYDILGISAGDYASQILFAGLRFTAAGIMAVFFGSILAGKFLIPQKESLIKISVLSLFQTVLQYLFFYIGLAHTTGTKGSIINSLGSFFAVIAAVVAGLEKNTLSKIAGCVLGFSGAVLVNLTGSEMNTHISFFGEGFIAFSAFAYAVSSILIKKYSEYENTVVLSGYQFIFGGAVMIVSGTAMGGAVSGIGMKSAALIFYLAFASAAAYTLWGILLKYNDVSRVAVFGFMMPVFGCFLSVIILKESLAELGVKGILALILVSMGIFIINKKSRGNFYEGKNDTCKGI